MKKLLCFIFFFATLQADEIPLIASLKNDPSVIIEGSVNVITGQPVAFVEDLVIQGKIPISICRTYIPTKRKGSWQICSTFARAYSEGDYSKEWIVSEPSGCPIIYREEKKFKKDGVYYLLCKPSNLGSGWCNTSDGKISSRSDPNNNELLVELPSCRHLILNAADGSVRTFKKCNSVYSLDLDDDSELLGGDYRLISERHSNGCWTLYDYFEKNKKHVLSSIRTTNPSRNKTFALAKFLYEDPYKKNKRFIVEGSDGQSAEYCFEIDPKTKRHTGELECIKFSHAPTQRFHTVRHTQTYSIWDKVKKKSWPYQEVYQRLGSISLPLGRSATFHYYLQDAEAVLGQSVLMQDLLYAPNWSYGNMVSPPWVVADPRRGRVKALSNALFTSHTFLYTPRKTSVIESAGRSEYHWKDDFRLNRIERFSSEGILLCTETFEWEKGRLVAKTSLDENNTPVSSRRYFYNARGDVTEERVYPDGKEEYRWVHTEYVNGLPVHEKHFSGKRITYEYQPNTDLLTCKCIYDKDVLVQRLTFEYNSDAVVVRATEEDGVGSKRITSVTPLASGPYIGLPEVVEEGYEKNGVYYQLRKAILTYTDKGNISQKDIYDAEGVYRYSLYTTYDERGRPIQTTNALGEVEEVIYDECDNPVQVKKHGVVTNHEYDRLNRLCSTTEGEWRATRSYDERNRVIAETNPWGAQTKYTWNALNKCTQTTKPLGAQIQVGYNSLGGEIFRIDGNGYRTQSYCNGDNKPLKVTHPDGANEKYTYTAEGWVQSYIDPVGIETTYEYDSLGRIRIKKVDDAKELFEYMGTYLTTHINAEGNQHHRRYDGAGRLIEEEFMGRVIVHRYDTLGRVAETQDSDLRTLWEYDLLDRVIEERKVSVSGEVLRKVRYAYDEAGNCFQTIQSVLGQDAIETRSYDIHKRCISTTNPLGHTEKTTYNDSLPLKVTHTDALGLKTIQTFDLQNRVIQTELYKEALLSREESFYDKNDNLLCKEATIFVPDRGSKVVSIKRRYDCRNRLIELNEADTKTTFYAYTPRSELAATTKPDGTILSYEYNSLGHLNRIVSSDGSVDHRMETNKLGYLLKTDGIERELDAEGHILQETFSSGYCIRNRFDTRGRRISCELPNRTIQYNYDALDLQVVRVSKDQEELYWHEYGSRDYSGNLLEETLLDGSKICYGIDPLSRRTALATPSFSQEILHYDAVGNVLEMRWQEEACSYTYDDLYNLTSESGFISRNYAFDSLRNRLKRDSEIYEINDLNQVVSHLEYDLNGNPIRYGDLEFRYDALNRLTSIIKPGLIQTFCYDSQNRRLSETSNGKTRYFLYDGQNEIGSLDEDLCLLELRILGQAPHAEIGAAVAVELKGALYIPIHDLQGNIAVLCPTEGNGFPSYYRYSAFGEEAIQGEVVSPWRFSSKRSEDGLIYFGRRFYSPDLGRWLTPDPAGFTDGMNLYAYVNNDPLTHFDEYGLMDIGQLERQREKIDIQNYLSGKYEFKNHYFHYVPPNFTPVEDNRPKGEIVLFTGIRTKFEGKNEFQDMVKYISNLAGDVPVHGVHMPTHGLFDDLMKCRNTLKTNFNSTVLHARQYFIEASKRVGENGRILAIGHSAGAMNCYFGGLDLPKEVRDKIFIRAFAPAKIVPLKPFAGVQNYMSSNQDLVMRFHQICHNSEYKEAQNSGLLVKLQAHPEASKLNDHSLMSPTFKPGLGTVLRPFTNQYNCR